MDSMIAIVPAAGRGQRAESAGAVPKQYRLLAGEAMLRRTVKALLDEPRIAQVRVAVAADDARAPDVLSGLPRTVWRACGGPTRADTVRAALLDADPDDEAWVLVHDAARPGLPLTALKRLIDTCLRFDRGGLLALPVADTVKRGRAAALGAQGAAADVVDETLSRDALWLAQTPQMFRAGELREALQLSIGSPWVTDEASAVEAMRPQHAPLLVQGARENVKLTWAEDFAWYARWLQGKACA